VRHPYDEQGASALAACGGASVTVTTTGSVDATKPGDYTITYSAGTASATRTVHVRDTKAPVIALTGSDPMALTCPSASGDPGAVAHDACAGDFPAVPSGSFDPLVAGSYQLTYNASDPSGNAALPVTRQLQVSDTTKPVITLNGANPATAECRSTYADAGGSANDACAGPLSLSSSGAVDTTTPGPYQIGYSATDPSQNTGNASRAVNVVDTIKPSIACPADISVQATAGTCAANVPFSVTRGDTCDANPTLGLSNAPGSSFNVGTTRVSATNTDHGGNSVGCGFNVTVTNTATAVALSLSHPTRQYSDPESLTAVVTNTQTNALVAGGTVTFKIGGSTVGTVAVGANGGGDAGPEPGRVGAAGQGRPVARRARGDGDLQRRRLLRRGERQQDAHDHGRGRACGLHGPELGAGLLRHQRDGDVQRERQGHHRGRSDALTAKSGTTRAA
jgi:hypothetical protein